jgi:WD40 repeat protein
VTPKLDAAGLYVEPFLVSDPGMHTALIRRMDSDADGRFLITGSDDKSVRVWARETGRLIRTIRVPAGPGNVGKIYAVAMSPDGSTIAAGGYTDPAGSHIYLFDRATGEQTGLIADLQSSTSHLAFSPDGMRLAAALGGANGVRLFDTAAWQQVAEDTEYGSDSYGIAFARDGRIAATSYDGKIRLYGPDLKRLRVADAPGGKQPFRIAFSPDGRCLAVGYRDRQNVDVLDSNALARLQVADTTGIDHGDLSTIAWSADGQRLFAGGRWWGKQGCELRVWTDDGRRVLGDYDGARNTIMSLRPFADGTLALAAADPRVALLDSGCTPMWSVDPQTADYRDQADKLAISGDATRVRFGFELFGLKPALFDLRGRQLQLDPTIDPALLPARTDGLAIVWKETLAPTLGGKKLTIDQYETSHSLAITSDASSFVLGCSWSLRRFNPDGNQVWCIDVPSNVWAVNLTPDARLVVAAYGDGTIRWHRLSDGSEVLAFFPHIDGKRWVVWTPLGHYVPLPAGRS